MTVKTTLIALSVALVFGALDAASVAQASARPDYANRGKAYAYAPKERHARPLPTKGKANGGNAYGSTSGEFINGNFIPRGTSPAQVPSFHEEDKYGSADGKVRVR